MGGCVLCSWFVVLRSLLALWRSMCAWFLVFGCVGCWFRGLLVAGRIIGVLLAGILSLGLLGWFRFLAACPLSRVSEKQQHGNGSEVNAFRADCSCSMLFFYNAFDFFVKSDDSVAVMFVTGIGVTSRHSIPLKNLSRAR